MGKFFRILLYAGVTLAAACVLNAIKTPGYNTGVAVLSIVLSLPLYIAYDLFGSDKSWFAMGARRVFACVGVAVALLLGIGLTFMLANSPIEGAPLWVVALNFSSIQACLLCFIFYHTAHEDEWSPGILPLIPEISLGICFAVFFGVLYGIRALCSYNAEANRVLSGISPVVYHGIVCAVIILISAIIIKSALEEAMSFEAKPTPRFPSRPEPNDNNDLEAARARARRLEKACGVERGGHSRDGYRCEWGNVDVQLYNDEYRYARITFSATFLYCFKELYSYDGPRNSACAAKEELYRDTAADLMERIASDLVSQMEGSRRNWSATCTYQYDCKRVEHL